MTHSVGITWALAKYREGNKVYHALAEHLVCTKPHPPRLRQRPCFPSSASSLYPHSVPWEILVPAASHYSDLTFRTPWLLGVKGMCLPSKCLTVKKAKNEPPSWRPRAHLHSVYFGTTHSPSRGRVLLQDFLFHLGLSFVLFSHTIPPQLFPSLGSRNLFVFIFPQRQKPN